MVDKGRTTSVYLDDKTLEMLKKVAERKGLLNISAAIRYVVREYFEKVWKENSEQW